MKLKDTLKLFHFNLCHKEQDQLLIKEILVIAVLTEIHNKEPEIGKWEKWYQFTWNRK